MSSWYGVVGHRRSTQDASVARHHVGVGGTVITVLVFCVQSGDVYRGPVCTFV